MEKIISLSDFHNIEDKIDKEIIQQKFYGGPKRTSITITDHDSGEILGEYHNKVVITGATFAAEQLWGVKSPVKIPSYNTELGLENTVSKDKENEPLICLFCIGDSGCGATEEEVFAASYIDRINPTDDIMPFRYVDADKDLNDDLRRYYYGRKVMNNSKIAYYFKKFDTTPQIHLKYTDGTDITENIYNVQTVQDAECYVESRLRITRTDFRDYIEQVLGWEKARISTLSLCSAWYTEKDGYRWYQDIYPYSKLNFSFEKLVDLTKAIDFQYSVFY